MTPSEADVFALLQQGAVLKGEFRWRRVDEYRWRAEAPLSDTYEDARVKVVGTYNERVHNLSYTLVWAHCRVRSLDVNGPPHRNPDGTRMPTPHKHRWTDAHRDRVAYIQTDITPTGTLEQIFREFLNESNIQFAGQYHAPVIQVGLGL